MTSSAAIRELEEKLETLDSGIREGASSRTPEVLATGIDRLDAVLPGGGLPCGRATEWWGVRSSGKTALLRAALAGRCAAGQAVAWVDAARTLYAPDWVPLVRTDGRFWAVRPGDPGEAGWCADLLLRSGAFDAVVLEVSTAGPPGTGHRASPSSAPGAPGATRPATESAPELSRRTAVRLQRLAEEAGAVLVVLGRVPVAGLRLRFRPGRVEPLVASPFGPFLPALRPVWVRVGKGGSAEIPVLCPLPGDRIPRFRTRDRKGRR